MDSIERARELFDRLEGRRRDVQETVFRAFEAQGRLAQIRA